MSDLIFLLILFVFVLILSATPLFRKSRSQRDYESSGMQLLATSRGRVLLLPALGCLCACIVTFFMVLMYQDIGFEASDIGSLLSCIGVTILLVVVCFLGGYAMQARHVLYNEEILLIGKPFRPALKYSYVSPSFFFPFSVPFHTIILILRCFINNPPRTERQKTPQKGFSPRCRVSFTSRYFFFYLKYSTPDSNSLKSCSP